MIVLITGASGSICKKLSAKLHENNHQVKFLTANLNKTSKTPNTFYWNIQTKQLDLEALRDVEVVVHLAGANIAKSRWTRDRKELLLDSRVETSRLLANGFKSLNKNIKKYISASAIGYFEENIMHANENSAAGSDFMATLCNKWEQSVCLFDDIAKSQTIFRTGIVLDPDSGFYTEIAKLAKYYLAAIPGSGKQWVSWISMDDMVDMYYEAIINPEVTGTYNGTAPNPTSLSSLIKGIAKNEKKRIILPNIPSFLLKLIFGQMSQVILSSKHVLPSKWIAEGRTFKHHYFEEVFQSWKK